MKFLLFLLQRLQWLAFCQVLSINWLVYTFNASLHNLIGPVEFLMLFYCTQFIVRYSVYFKVRWPSENLMMNLLMRYFWKTETWFSRNKRTRVSVVLLFNGLNQLLLFSSAQEFIFESETKLSASTVCNDLLNSSCRIRHYFVLSCFILYFLV